MTKIGIVSDLHLKHWANYDFLPVSWVLRSIEQEKPDILIDAGDLELPAELITGVDTISIPGNHDYYGKQWHGDPLHDCQVMILKGLKIVSTTLWMDFNNHSPISQFLVGRYLNDFRLIEGFTTQVCYDTHLAQREWLVKQFPCDIVVTHHSPTFKSIARKYFGDPMNFGFHSDLDWLVEKSQAKLWVHGHTHEACDYYLGNTQIICNPCGYPSEGHWEDGREYQPVYVEL